MFLHTGVPDYLGGNHGGQPPPPPPQVVSVFEMTTQWYPCSGQGNILFVYVEKLPSPMKLPGYVGVRDK